ncbi:MAG: 2-oxoglutarate dehydrogenase E1 component [Pseudomonadota bacterium]
MVKQDSDDSYLFSGNASFVEALYRQFLSDPASVDPAWRSHFEALGPFAAEPDHENVRRAFLQLTRQPRVSTSVLSQSIAEQAGKQVAVLQLINAYRVRGHQQAKVEPLGLNEQPPLPELSPAFHHLNETDMDTVFSTGSLAGPAQSPLRDILQRLQTIYCEHIGVEYMHITGTEQKRWIQQRLENHHGHPEFSPGFKRQILERLIAAEGLEQYLHTRYVGQKRFSLEGGDSLIPLLNELIQRAGGQQVREVVIGMAHRGRLNVLVNIMGKSPKDLFMEFEGKCEIGGKRSCGDVKYHQGFSSDVRTSGGPVHLALAFNPSHLEIINPVVEGSVRARQHRRRDLAGNQVLPVLIHGDAAFAGQGVVMETLNMSQARGFVTGGTIHIVINNQIGFTLSDPLDARSSLYCTDVARMVQAPIFHVNGDDPEAVIHATQLALDYRMQFNRDAVIDLVCYRRHGHNEADEPAVTQPLMYRKIRHHPPVPRRYAERLIGEGAITGQEVESMIVDYRKALDDGRTVAREIIAGEKNPHAVDWTPYLASHWRHAANTAVPVDKLRALAECLLKLPEGFALHPRVAKIMADRRDMAAGKLPLDWGFAETLAYATLLRDGYPVRISGQDSGRGTFFHRHAVLHHQEDGGTYVPLQHLLDDAPQHFIVIDSLLSEEAVLGFEYGYATASPESLVIWEAQFGDFANGAQVLIDQFISSGEVKWGRLCGLALFLPHGYDGQGPEHSSARLERYLQLCSEDNMQVCAPTTPAQIFHLLRRQMLRPYRKPLVVMTPKNLLRHKLAVSRLEELAVSGFKTVLDEVDALKADDVRRVVVCAGKIYYELLEARRARGIEDIAILRLEQLHPLPMDELRQTLMRFRKARELVWCQEEPGNQGAWNYMQPVLRDCLQPRQGLSYAGRPSYAAPAEGYLSKHLEQQATLINAALEFSKNTAMEKKCIA